MLSNVLDRISFWALFVVVVLLPVFFLPFTRIPIETSKSLLLVVGLSVSIIFWAAARFSDGKIIIPKSNIILAGLGLVFAVLISTIFSGAFNVSLFGTMFDVGTFWFIFAAFLLMFMTAITVRSGEKAMMIILGVTLSFVVVYIFQMFRFFMPNTLSLGLLGGKTDNLVGVWNTLGIMSGLTGVLSLFVIEFFKVPKSFKFILGILLALSLVMSIAVNFSLVWELLGLFALIIFVYKISLSAGVKEEGKSTSFPIFSFAIVLVSLLFFMSGQFIGGLLPERLGLSNIEIRPSVSSTMSIGKSSLMKDPAFGIGPNRFNELWAMYKPASINATRFWDTSFSNGSGLLPTLAITTGIVGIISWLLFLVLFVIAGAKMLFANIKKGISSEITLFFLAAFYLFIASLFYSTGIVVFMLAFTCVGIFVGLSSSTKEGKTMTLSFLDDPRKSFFSILLLIVLMVISAGVTFKFIERFASVAYLSKVFSADTMPKAEAAINRALLLNQNDLYFRTATQVYVTKMNTLLNKGSQLTDQEKADLQNSFDVALNTANRAVVYNSKNYLNYQSLGAVYQKAIPLGAEGASTKAIEAYMTASTLSPNNPGLKLAIAQLYLSENKIADAKNLAQEALTLKPDYIDGLVVMSQISRSEGNNKEALSYAEQALLFAPSDTNLIQYVNALKGINAPKPEPVVEEDTKTKEN